MFTKTKSSGPDFSFNNQSKITIHKIDLLLNEQVAQRKDLSIINALLKSLIADVGVQRQVDEYFEEGKDTVPGLADTRDSKQREEEEP